MIFLVDSIQVAHTCIIFFVETFQMGKIHKDIAMFMVEAAKNDEYNDQKLVKVVITRLFRLPVVVKIGRLQGGYETLTSDGNQSLGGIKSRLEFTVIFISLWVGGWQKWRHTARLWPNGARR